MFWVVDWVDAELSTLALCKLSEEVDGVGDLLSGYTKHEDSNVRFLGRQLMICDFSVVPEFHKCISE